MKRRLVIAILVPGGMFAQEAGAPAFEVASIKPSTPQTRTLGIYTFPGGRITGENRTLRDLMEEAFSVPTFRAARIGSAKTGTTSRRSRRLLPKPAS